MHLYANNVIRLLAVVCLLLQTVKCQVSTSKLGCTFGDDKNIYNIDLVAGQQNLPCPSTEAKAQLALSTDVKSDQVYKSARQLQQLADQLTDRNVQLWDKIELLKNELKQAQAELAKQHTGQYHLNQISIMLHQVAFHICDHL